MSYSVVFWLCCVLVFKTQAGKIRKEELQKEIPAFVNEIPDYDTIAHDIEKIGKSALVEPLKPNDLKCLISSTDDYCSEQMAAIKSVLLKSGVDGCKMCTLELKLESGRVLSALLMHEPEVFKIFLDNVMLRKEVFK